MSELIRNFPAQLDEALEIARTYQFKNGFPSPIRQVVLCGLGGSGIGGTIVQDYVLDKIKVPFVVHKSYNIPAFVDQHTLVIACSYSGNTEETLEAYATAHRAGAVIVGITSGGKLAANCSQDSQDCIMVPAGMPPRACLGYSIVQIITILVSAGLLSRHALDELSSAAIYLREHSESIAQKATSLAGVCSDKMPVIYAAAGMEGVAVRWRQQLNENGKMLCWHGIVPEMNHNELVGWHDQHPELCVLFLKSDFDGSRNVLRMRLCRDLISQRKATVHELRAEGNTWWQQAFYLIHLGDWLSLYCAEHRRVDPVEVRVIDFLKSELARG